MNIPNRKRSYNNLAPFLAATNASPRKYIRLENDPFMPLVLEYLHYADHRGLPVYSITHYGEQNGDAMRDPDMEFSVDFQSGEVYPLTFQNDYMGVYQEVYSADGKRYHPGLLRDLESFLATWTRNIVQQGFDPFRQQTQDNE